MKIYNSTNKEINRSELMKRLRKHAPYANTDSEVIRECEKQNLAVSIHNKRRDGITSYNVFVEVPEEKIIF